ncbi:hypothetical protein Pint_16742 [Pistacia integerrima]|uniref:Uncharacterized protein n=1 Tax=Pistacia integerrima TaxID=434235 RepID=A0ACC0ZCQ1_9ROSI|nr:hypothetical protein Pint_16742 [Pistacia integerrima]
MVAEDPLVLERVDEMSFVTTPLHAARDHLGRGLLHLALEGKHLQEGRSPGDSELEEKYQELVTWLIRTHPGLIRVKAKGMVTPLHYAAQLDDEINLADFLYVCPSSIEDFTVKSETAIHVAIKNWSFKAFKVLFGWLRHFDKEEILKWEDEEGNNALHTAISENQPELQAGHMIQGSPAHFFFLILNILAFSTSVTTIIVIINGLPFSRIIGLSTTLIVLAYCSAVIETCPYPVGSGSWYALGYSISLIVSVAYAIPLLLCLRDWFYHTIFGQRQLRLGRFEKPKM